MFHKCLWTSLILGLLGGQTLPPQNIWTAVNPERLYSVSGIAVYQNEIWVVHDNKAPGQPRLGQIKVNGGTALYKPINWPGALLPFDLEDMAVWPDGKQVAVLESAGKVTLLKSDSDGGLKMVRHFDLERESSTQNFESLSFFSAGTKTYAFWATRGSDSTASAIYWGVIPDLSNTVEIQGSTIFKTPWPELNVRHISSMDIGPKGWIWIASDSDPGDDGPFTSAVYLIGRVDGDRHGVHVKLFTKPEYSERFPGHKIEAVVRNNRGLLVGTDDENLGGAIRFIDTRQEK